MKTNFESYIWEVFYFCLAYNKANYFAYEPNNWTIATHLKITYWFLHEDDNATRNLFTQW